MKIAAPKSPNFLSASVLRRKDGDRMNRYRIRRGSIADIVTRYSGHLAFAMCMLAMCIN